MSFMSGDFLVLAPIAASKIAPANPTTAPLFPNFDIPAGVGFAPIKVVACCVAKPIPNCLTSSTNWFSVFPLSLPSS